MSFGEPCCLFGTGNKKTFAFETLNWWKQEKEYDKIGASFHEKGKLLSEKLN
jgi:hypothetical protein